MLSVNPYDIDGKSHTFHPKTVFPRFRKHEEHTVSIRKAFSSVKSPLVKLRRVGKLRVYHRLPERNDNLVQSHRSHGGKSLFRVREHKKKHAEEKYGGAHKSKNFWL